MSEQLFEIKNNVKYNYTNIENSEKIYLFEINLNNNNNNNIIRKIRYNKNDKLLSLEDQIEYNKLKKIKIIVIDVNNPKNKIFIKSKIDQNKKSIFINNKKIQLSINKITLGYTEINYNILV